MTVTIELVYALMVGFVLWHTHFIAIPLYALTVWHCFRLFQTGKLLPLQEMRKKETKTIDIFLHAYHLPLKYFGFGLVLGCYRLEALSVKFKKYK